MILSSPVLSSSAKMFLNPARSPRAMKLGRSRFQVNLLISSHRIGQKPKVGNELGGNEELNATLDKKRDQYG